MLRVKTEFQSVFQRLGLTSCESVIQHFGGTEGPSRAEEVKVRESSLSAGDGSSTPVFFKQYSYAPPAWKFIGRRSKARCEFENYEVFARLGIPAAEAIAYGEKRDGLGRLSRAFIITRTIRNAVTLKEFVEKNCANKSDSAGRKVRLKLLRQMADLTRRIHGEHFFHHDLVWRNILVTWLPPAEPKLWWIDCPRGQFDRWSPLRWRRRLKDLASLDKVASQLCTARERLRFVKLYLGKSRLDAEAKRLIQAVLDYRRTRWPDDWK